MCDIQEMTGFKLLADETKIWRYMAFDKFQSVLTESALYFASARQFSDAFEGANSKVDHQLRLRGDLALGDHDEIRNGMSARHSRNFEGSLKLIAGTPVRTSQKRCGDFTSVLGRELPFKQPSVASSHHWDASGCNPSTVKKQSG
jgi:hypothetical protein